MSKLKKSICKFINKNIFPDSMMELKNDCYAEEKLRVANEINKLENSYSNLKREYTTLANEKFCEAVNNDLQRGNERLQEQILEQENNNERNPFDDWRM